MNIVMMTTISAIVLKEWQLVLLSEVISEYGGWGMEWAKENEPIRGLAASVFIFLSPRDSQ